MVFVVLYCTVMYYIRVSPWEQYITGLTEPEGQLRDRTMQRPPVERRQERERLGRCLESPSLESQ